MKTRPVMAGLFLMVASGFAGTQWNEGEYRPCSTPKFVRCCPVGSQDSTAGSFYVVAEYDPERNPSEDLERAVERAKSENKRILLEVGGEWCVWCHLLHDFLISHERVTAALDDGFLVIRVNYGPANENETFLSRFPEISGYPHIFVLDTDGSLLHSQRTELLEEGRSYNEAAVLSFLDKWKPVP